MARPSKYREEFAEQAQKLCLLGATDEALANFFGVSRATISTWKIEHPAFLDALKAGKELADATIAECLYHRAKGYSHPEDDIRTVTLPDGGGSEIVITPTTKHYPPDPTSMIFWLKNRRPDLWRDKPTEADGDEVPPPVRIEVTVRDASIRADAEHAASAVSDA